MNIFLEKLLRDQKIEIRQFRSQIQRDREKFYKIRKYCFFLNFDDTIPLKKEGWMGSRILRYVDIDIKLCRGWLAISIGKKTN